MGFRMQYLGVVIAVGLTACGGSGGGGSPQSKGDLTDGFDGAIIGNWIQDCTNDDQTPAMFSYRMEMNLDLGGAFAVKYQSFTGPDCLSGALQTSGKISGRYSTARSVIQIDPNSLRDRMTIHSADVVTAYNQGKVCGRTDWQVNIEAEECESSRTADPSEYSSAYRFEGNDLLLTNSDGSIERYRRR